MRVMKLTLDSDKNRVDKDSWVESEEVSESTMKRILSCNLRELYSNEILLDCESSLKANIVKDKLEEDSMAYIEYDTGSRGKHFHILYKNMGNLSEKLRIKYREKVINKYNTDDAVTKGFIAMEYRPHFKRGNIKKEIDRKEGMFGLYNELNMKLVREAKKDLAEEQEQKKTGLKKVYGSDDVEELKSKITPEQLWYHWGMTNMDKRRHDTPFANSSSQRCVSINGDVWYDFHTRQGGDIFTAVQLKHDCGFREAIDRLKKGNY